MPDKKEETEFTNNQLLLRAGIRDRNKMEYKKRNHSIVVTIPAVNSGKFRFKTRMDKVGFGKIFPTRKDAFNAQVYLEWQVGYDATKQEIDKGKKHTSLRSISFTGANKKEKYPYELAELLFDAGQIGLVSKKALNALSQEVDGYTDFIDKREIETDSVQAVVINDLQFQETRTKLPTFFKGTGLDGTQIEVSIEKQQYASGTQPMLYLCIPFRAFSNHESLEGKSSEKNSKLDWVINEQNVSVILDAFRVFAMCSQNHRHDVKSILDLLRKDNRD